MIYWAGEVTMHGYGRAGRMPQSKLITIVCFLLGAFCFSSGAINTDFLYDLLNSNIFQIMFGIYVFSGGFMILASNLYLIFSGHGLVPSRGNLHKTPAVVQISYRYFYRPIIAWIVFLAGGALSNIVF